jgi:arginase
MISGSAAVKIIAVPFHLATPDAGMGRGPAALLARGGLEPAVGVSEISRSGLDGPEVGRILQICERVRVAVATAFEQGSAPLILSGNCVSACVPAAAALTWRHGPGQVGVVWFDAHADFDEPTTTESSFFDGMGAAVLVGDAYPRLASLSVSGFAPIPLENVVMVGVRDLEPYQRQRITASGLRALPPDSFAGLASHLEAIAPRIDGAYLHFDLDSLDTSCGAANEYAAAGGLTLEQALEGIDQVFDKLPVSVAAVTAYNPDVDPDGQMLGNARAILDHLIERLA